ncbi:MAG: hypothetical protein ACLU38_07140 [Dysosmobacter sp.]
MRPDGTRVKDLPPLVAAIPYIMPKRYDAWNSITENASTRGCESLHPPLAAGGRTLNHMASSSPPTTRPPGNPKLNCFVMNAEILSAATTSASPFVIHRSWSVDGGPPAKPR